ncbi:serine protease FAM111A-like [Odontesthes bonariensis]|uniref:serine protease FAM111A-like n=1 Tax=Odontesthes bonariensis TaxID=219752 RepID=UPI003F5856EE
MDPKRKNAGKEKLPDIRNFLEKANDSPGVKSPPTKKSRISDYPKAQKKVKEESTKDAVSSGKHEHCFKVKFGSDDQKYTIDCHQPQTLLEAIKSHLADEFNQKINGADENIIIRLGEGADASLLATNFPCSCVEEDECLTVSTSKRVMEAQNQTRYQVQEKEHYCVFYIENVGGKDSKSKAKQIFRCTDIREEFKYFCVYGEKSEMTVEQALKQDGRFVDDLSDFALCDNKNKDITKCTASVSGKMNKRCFRIQLPKDKRFKTKGTKQPASNGKQPASHVKQEQQKTQCASNDSQSKSETISVLERAQEKGISVKEAIRETGTNVNMQEIYDLLREQFQGLKGWMENRFPGQSFKKALKVSKENFGKIQQSFSKVSTVRELVKLSESVCLLRISDTSSSKSFQGTGFVLFDNFILTNAHLCKDFANRGIEKWWEYIKITAEFHFESHAVGSKKLDAKVFIDNPSVHPFSTITSGSRQNIPAPVGSDQLDCVLLELIPETSDVPPGLLKRFGPLPGDGEACVVGHPAGEVKKMDPTCIIRKDERDQAVDKSLEDYQDYLFTVCSVKQAIEKEQLADVVVTYKNSISMYHGSSGSPVFDAHGQVFGLHSGGFFFGFPKPDHSVIEYCYPLLSIFKELVSSLKKAGSTAVLARVCEEAKGNPYLENIIEVVAGAKDESSREGESSDSEELMDTH